MFIPSGNALFWRSSFGYFRIINLSFIEAKHLRVNTIVFKNPTFLMIQQNLWHK